MKLETYYKAYYKLIDLDHREKAKNFLSHIQMLETNIMINGNAELHDLIKTSKELYGTFKGIYVHKKYNDVFKIVGEPLEVIFDYKLGIKNNPSNYSLRMIDVNSTKIYEIKDGKLEYVPQVGETIIDVNGSVKNGFRFLNKKECIKFLKIISSFQYSYNLSVKGMLLPQEFLKDKRFRKYKIEMILNAR